MLSFLGFRGFVYAGLLAVVVGVGFGVSQYFSNVLSLSGQLASSQAEVRRLESRWEASKRQVERRDAWIETLPPKTRDKIKDSIRTGQTPPSLRKPFDPSDQP